MRIRCFMLRPGVLWICTLLLSTPLIRPANGYDIIRDYSGQTFFDGWDFYGSWDNLTLGDVWWLDASDAFAQGLAYVNSNGNAIIKVDNTSNVPFNQKRNSVRITTHDAYSLGSLWIFDVVHLPYGCSVWPAIWSFGPNWPWDGEIDIMEGINLMSNNQMALHTVGGCGQAPNAYLSQTGTTIQGDCSHPEGCTVGENKPNSYQSGFAAAGGGVWAAQFDVSGIYMWFWSRPNIPPSILAATADSGIDVSDFGTPSASYPSTTCNMPQFFSPQNLVIDITLCGSWAGVPSIYAATCSNTGPTGICYNDHVVGNGANYNEAYFEISYVRAYTTGEAATTEPPIAIHSTTWPTMTTTITAWETTTVVTYISLPAITDTNTASGPQNTSPNGGTSIKNGMGWPAALLASLVSMVLF